MAKVFFCKFAQELGFFRHPGKNKKLQIIIEIYKDTEENHVVMVTLS